MHYIIASPSYDYLLLLIITLLRCLLFNLFNNISGPISIKRSITWPNGIGTEADEWNNSVQKNISLQFHRSTILSPLCAYFEMHFNCFVEQYKKEKICFFSVDQCVCVCIHMYLVSSWWSLLLFVGKYFARWFFPHNHLHVWCIYLSVPHLCLVCQKIENDEKRTKMESFFRIYLKRKVP